MSRDICEPDSSGTNWFVCAKDTVGCPWIHDGRTPHCIACAEGRCEMHKKQHVLERAEAELGGR